MRIATPATDEAFRLAEGPVWDVEQQRLCWVDILAGLVCEGRLDNSRIQVIRTHRFDGMVGAVAAGPDGTLLVAGQEQLVALLPDGSRHSGPRIIPSGQRRRLNDGATDPAGRFLVGTLSLDGASTSETLVRWEHDGGITELDDDLTLSNGLAWSTDGRTMYSVDTMRRTVFARDYGPDGPRRIHLRIDGGVPDGIAVDADDHLWVAVWGAGEVRRYAPDGALIERVSVPAPNTSSVAFAGPDLRTLVITTASAELDPARLREHPYSGRLFTIRVDVPGLPVMPWAGTPALT